MSRIKAFYFFPQIGRIGEIAHRIPKIRNLYPDDVYDLTILLAGTLSQAANAVVLEMVCRGVATRFVSSIEEAQNVYAAVKAEDDRTFWVNPEPVNTYLDFLLQFHHKSRNFVCTLNGDDLEKGKQLRARMGIPQNAPIVSFHVRESGFLPQMEYHDYRNANIQNYLYALLHLLKKGYWVIRFGDSSMQPLKAPLEHLIDAPIHPEYEPFFEPYFIASSRFYLGVPSGPSMVAEAFMVPQLMTNAPYAANTCENEGDMFIYKKYFSHQLGRALSYEEIITGPLLDYHRKYLFEHAEITLIENTPSEIFAAVWEMESRLSRSYPFMEEAQLHDKQVKEIQKKAHILRQALITNDYFPAIPLHAGYLQRGVISNEFIRMNPGFLGQKYPVVNWGFHPEIKELPKMIENFYLRRLCR